MPNRTLTYWRAQWLGDPIPGYRDLEAVLRALHQALPSVQASAVTRGDGAVIEVRHRRVENGTPILLHCAMHEPGAQGSVVPRPQADLASGPLRTIPPPDGADFLGGALVALVSGNHCLVCAAGLTTAALRYYIQQLVIRVGYQEHAARATGKKRPRVGTAQ